MCAINFLLEKKWILKKSEFWKKCDLKKCEFGKNANLEKKCEFGENVNLEKKMWILNEMWNWICKRSSQCSKVSFFGKDENGILGSTQSL